MSAAPTGQYDGGGMAEAAAPRWPWSNHVFPSVQQVRVKKELPSTVTCNYKSILYNFRSERHAIHEPEMLSDLPNLLRCEDVLLTEDHPRGVLQSK